MPDLNDGESVEMQGSGSRPYVLKNTGGVYSCTCPAWRNQSIGIERRSCKHLAKASRGSQPRKPASAPRFPPSLSPPLASRPLRRSCWPNPGTASPIRPAGT